jgi:hypothetical protein
MARVSLGDVIEFGAEVELGDGNTALAYGISLDDALILIDKFPELKVFALEGIDAVKALTPEQIFKVAPNAIAAIIAAGNGMAGNATAEQNARRMPLQAQFDFLDKILERTMPDGPDPFLARVQVAVAVGRGFLTGIKNPEPSATLETTSQPQSEN